MNTGKLTKIVATIAYQHCEVPFLKALFEAGMNVVRLNTAHLEPEQTSTIIKSVRAVSENIPFLIDTKGPEIRTTILDEKIQITEGMIISFKGDPTQKTTNKCIYTTYVNFVNDLSVGNTILIDDGALGFEVIEKKADELICKALNSSVLGARKSINLPGVRTNLPSLNEKDKMYIQYAIDNEIDFIAHSFVRHKQDILDVKALLGEYADKIRIIAKIENQEGVNNIDEILDHTYGVMIARGDLGIEIPEEKLPGVQRLILKKCKDRRKPVIIATQMMHSMIENPRPTRAEVTDVANAVYQGTDAIMLSGETAYGKYPVETVEMMTKIAREIESERPSMRDCETVILSTEASAFLTKQAVTAAVQLNAMALVADTHTGSSIRNIAGFRGRKPVFALCYRKDVARALSLSYGVFPIYYPSKQAVGRNYIHTQFLYDAATALIQQGYLTEDDLIVVIGGNFNTNQGASFMEITKVRQLLNIDK
mgnify:CR=1 FL=1